MNRLEELAYLHGTDKSFNNYAKYYYNILHDFVDATRSVLEFGVYKGDSLKMWADFFPNATIHGVDVTFPKKINHPRIVLHNGSAVDPNVLGPYSNNYFDLIIDDASHRTSHQLKTLDIFLHKVAIEGYYIIEDMHTSFMDNYIDTKHTSYHVLKNILELGPLYLSEATMHVIKNYCRIRWFEEAIPPPATNCAIIIERLY